MAATFLAASCARPQVVPPHAAVPAVVPAVAPSTPTPAVLASEPVAVPTASLPRSVRVEAPPPLGIVAPLAGEPATDELVAARLVKETCAVDPKALEAEVRQMRKDVDEAFAEWQAAQHECNVERSLERAAEREAQKNGWRAGELSPLFGSGAGGLTLNTYGSGGLGGASLSAGLDAVAPAAAVGASPRRAGEPATAARTSKTNDQVEGVEEADIVKTDGRYVYLATGGALRIVTALEPRVLSTTRLPGQVREMVVVGDRAVVLSSIGRSAPRCTYGYDCQFAGDGSATTVTVLALGDRTSPRRVRTLDLSGSLLAARRIGTTLHLVASQGDLATERYPTWPDELERCTNWEPGARAAFAKLKRDNEQAIRARRKKLPSVQDGASNVDTCGDVYRTRLADGQAFTSLVSFDVTRDKVPPKVATIQSRPGAVYASRDGLYFAVTHRRASGGDWYGPSRAVDEVSEVHKFRIGSDPSATAYVGSGTVPGHVLNQFAMDEWHGYLRVVTSVGRVPDPSVSSSVSVLAETPKHDLVRIGAVDRIAPREDVRAVRFDGSRGYVVTFKKTDPLFVLDLHDPQRPQILGELKIPGFSTYLHRLDPDHLLSIGFDADDQGGFAYFNGLLLQLFDVTNPTDPKLMHREKLGTRGSSSEAATNHLAFNYLRETGTLAIPATVCEGGGQGRNGDTLAFSGLVLYDVSLERGFEKLGGIDHGTKGASCSTWWSRATSQVKRSLFVDDLVYSIAEDRVKVQRLGKLGTDVADLALAP